MGNPIDDESRALDGLARLIGPPPDGETWLGDDAAVVAVAGGTLLFATDVVVEHVHFDRRWCSLADVGWKSLAVNVSDIAAMGGTPLSAVVGVSGASADEVVELYRGLVEAAAQYGCPIVGGDLSDGAALHVAVAITGTPGGRVVLRSGAQPGDHVFVTGELGASAAGLRLLVADETVSGPLVDAYRRPVARLGEGAAAAAAGATAMIDVSDGLGIDIDRLAKASGVGVRLEDIPVASGATPEDALGGGEDYELVFTAPGWAQVESVFADAGFEVPARIGEIVADEDARTLRGRRFDPEGWTHTLG